MNNLQEPKVGNQFVNKLKEGENEFHNLQILMILKLQLDVSKSQTEIWKAIN